MLYSWHCTIYFQPTLNQLSGNQTVNLGSYWSTYFSLTHTSQFPSLFLSLLFSLSPSRMSFCPHFSLLAASASVTQSSCAPLLIHRRGTFWVNFCRLPALHLLPRPPPLPLAFIESCRLNRSGGSLSSGQLGVVTPVGDARR